MFGATVGGWAPPLTSIPEPPSAPWSGSAVSGAAAGSAPPTTHRWSGLDGLRALAVSVVVAYHFGVFPPGGAVGVDLFFVISGFLITSLLLREHERTDRISLGRFWARRALRLFPALACAIVFAVVVCLISTDALRRDTLAGLPWVVLYSGNWVRAFGSSPTSLGLLGHSWSLAVEEQFYLVWPLLCLAWIARTKNRVRAASLLATFVLIDCIYLVAAMNQWGSLRAYYGTDTHAMGLLAGAALALLASTADPGGLRRDATGANVLRVAGMAGLFLFLAVAVMFPNSGTESALMIIAATVASVLLVARVAFVRSGHLVAVLSSKPVAWVGQRSYGIYLYHVIVAGLLFEYCHWTGVPRAGALAFSMVLVLVVAALSYRFIESPFLRVKARLTSGAVEHRIAVAVAEPAGSG